MVGPKATTVEGHCSKATSGFSATIKPVHAGFRGKIPERQAAFMKPKVNKSCTFLFVHMHRK